MCNIKLAISNIAWDKENDRDLYSFLKEHKFSGLEIAPTKIFEENPYEHLEDARKFKESLKREYGLDVCSMQSIWFGRTENIFKSEDERNILIKYTKKAIDFAEAIGCSNLVFGCPKNRNITDENEDNYSIACDFFKELGSYASSKGVVIAIEPNPVIYNTNFLNTTKEAIDFVKELGVDSIKINCDLGTIIYNAENVDLIINNVDLINHIHISEPNLEVPEKRELHKTLLDKLEKVGYSKFVSIEMKKTDLEVVKSIIDYVASL